MESIRTSRQIGGTIRKKRLQLGLTQQELADAAQVSRSLIVRLEKGTATSLYPEKLIAVLHRLGLSLVLVDSENEASAPLPPMDSSASTSVDGADSEQRIREVLADFSLDPDLFKARPSATLHQRERRL